MREEETVQVDESLARGGKKGRDRGRGSEGKRRERGSEGREENNKVEEVKNENYDWQIREEMRKNEIERVRKKENETQREDK